MTLVWSARLALVGLALLAIVGLLEPTARPTEILVRPDQISHALVIYGVTLLAAMSLPRVRPLTLGCLFIFLGGGVEIAQHVGVVPGAAQFSDFMADLVGIAAALFPVGVVRARRVIRSEASSTDERLD